jgi:hypothetical protein
MAINVPDLTLNNGAKMPQVGFGLWKVENKNCADIVYNAIKTGYRLFDGACGTSYLLLDSGVPPTSVKIPVVFFSRHICMAVCLFRIPPYTDPNQTMATKSKPAKA